MLLTCVKMLVVTYVHMIGNCLFIYWTIITYVYNTGLVFTSVNILLYVH